MMVKAKAVTSGQVIAIKRQAAGKVTVVGKTGQVPVVITSEQAATLRKVSGSSGKIASTPGKHAVVPANRSASSGKHVTNPPQSGKKK